MKLEDFYKAMQAKKVSYDYYTILEINHKSQELEAIAFVADGQPDKGEGVKSILNENGYDCTFIGTKVIEYSLLRK